ncbi:hypothetical protein [Atlantibacter sp.]|uniref:hypothetical protein n=1 Tax=Atlantibacter sp. TaxID=1903473 RepID=UPI0028B083E7|nr:hypothetical protein [Atlantibacter sp.]
MRFISTIILSSLLAGCVISSPQKAQYKAEYSHRQDIRQHTVYKFNTKPISPSGKSYRGSGNLTTLFKLSDKNASKIQLRFDYPAKSLEAVSLDAQDKILDKQTFTLLDKSADKPSDSQMNYFYLTKDGQLVYKTRNCTPDMSIGCQWWAHSLFITRNGDMAVHYENGSAVMLFLILPAYGSNEYLEIFSKAPYVSGIMP